MFSAIYCCLYLLFSRFLFLFHLLFPSLLAMRHIYNLQCLIQFHYNLPIILWRYEKLHRPLPKKKVHANYNQPNALISLSKKDEFFLSLYQIILFLVFDHAHAVTSHFNEFLSMNFYNYFVTKRSLDNTPYRKFSLNSKQHSKTRRQLNLRNELSLN